MAREAIKPNGSIFQVVHEIGLTVKRELTSLSRTWGWSATPIGETVSWVQANNMLKRDMSAWLLAPSRESLTALIVTATALLVRYTDEGV
jgi:hypothetical protein